ncbi:hypothetical protein BDW59DRAFT_140055 [Aspergillus cavernicola]|uniref:Uncharacterized protein n=1 Tax=Aspergillus cavernicola TaxID=176166 RepID=A0ABR4IY69_9EURO
MNTFASFPQARFLKLTASDPESAKSFDASISRGWNSRRGIPSVMRIDSNYAQKTR